MKRTLVLPALLMSLAAIAAACGPTKTATPTEAASQAGLPNPASVFCEANGGTLELRTGPGGGQIGVCVFPDGGECEEWAYFRGECAPLSMPGVPASPTSAAPSTVQPVTLQLLLPEDGSLIE